MTTSLGIQLTPGQRCLIELLQRKLLYSIQLYARYYNERSNQPNEVAAKLDEELLRLKNKIRRISARQKRFTLEIINGNGNNTIPKESFFQALGLVTKEALNKLNSKTNERRRRTTANPRFSHEAIQAKRALEPLPKRLEPRAVRDNSKREPNAGTRRQQSRNTNNSNLVSSKNNNDASHNSNISTRTGAIQNGGKSASNQQAPNTGAKPKSRTTQSSRQSRLNEKSERKDLLYRFDLLKREIGSRLSQIKVKEESNRKLELENEIIRQRGLNLISAIKTSTNVELETKIRQEIEAELTAINNGNYSCLNLEIKRELDHLRKNTDTKEAKHQPTDTSSKDVGHDGVEDVNQPARSMSLNDQDSMAVWIDMKCDESLDGLD